MNKPMTQKSIIQMTQLAVLAAISVVLIAFVRIPLIPAAPFLEYDMADAPILIAALLFGSGPAFLVLFVVSIIQSMFFGSNGWVGLVMHLMASGALVYLVGEFYKKKQRFTDAVIGMVLGTLAMTALMVPMNYIFTVHFFGMPKAVLDTLIWPAIIPFNLLKAGLNSAIAAVLFKSLQPFVQKNREMIHPV